jgi:hypothetical protein
MTSIYNSKTSGIEMPLHQMGEGVSNGLMGEGVSNE